MWDLDPFGPQAWGAQSLSPRTAREVPSYMIILVRSVFCVYIITVSVIFTLNYTVWFLRSNFFFLAYFCAFPEIHHCPCFVSVSKNSALMKLQTLCQVYKSPFKMFRSLWWPTNFVFLGSPCSQLGWSPGGLCTAITARFLTCVSLVSVLLSSFFLFHPIVWWSTAPTPQ